jgi:glycosyltransferase involved in cell wall biosynthesis
MKVSVVICTWNRAALLRRTLAEMCKLEIPAGVEWELLVVNNNCSDDTDEASAEFATTLPLRVLHESTPGKSYAANLAIREAHGDLILWTDDDVLVDPGWLSNYVEAASEWPEAAFFGGTIEPWFETTPPDWLERHFHRLESCYAIRRLGRETRVIRSPEDGLPFGANMAVRRSVHSEFIFNSRLGPSKDDQVRGEETELLSRILKTGCIGVWVGDAAVRHFIPRERLTEQFVVNWFSGYGRMLCRRSNSTAWPKLWKAPRWALRKYAQSWMLAMLLRPFRNTSWIKAVQATGTWRGFILETRAAVETKSC